MVVQQVHGTPTYGVQKINWSRKKWQAIDNPTESQLASNIVKCVGISAIQNKCIMYYKGNLWYRPLNSSNLVPIALNGSNQGVV